MKYQILLTTFLASLFALTGSFLTPAKADFNYSNLLKLINDQNRTLKESTATPCPTCTISATAKPRPSPSPETPTVQKNSPVFFQNTEVLKFDLDTDLGKIDTGKKGAKTSGKLKVHGLKTLDVELETRGKSRLRVCHPIPPLKVRFVSEKKGTPFQGAGKTLKMVAPCYNSKPELREDYAGKATNFDEMLIREYWIYKMIEATGLPSFKTRRGLMKYQGKEIPVFFIEDSEDVAANLGAHPHVSKPLDPSEFKISGENDLLDLLSGSRDSHNGKNSDFIRGNDGTVHRIRYDFDLSPLVSADWDLWDRGMKSEEIVETAQKLGSVNKEEVLKVLSHQADVFKTIAGSDLSTEDKVRFKAYYEKVFKALKDQSEYFF